MNDLRRVLVVFFLLFLSACTTKKVILNNEYSSVYEITEFLDDEHYDEYMNDDGTLFSKVLDYKNRINSSSEFVFYAFCNNFLEVIDENIPEECAVNYGNDHAKDSYYEIVGEEICATEAIQISNNFFDLFESRVSKGRTFEENDLNKEKIPVLLGKAYERSYELNDTFDAYYLCERRTFEVIGFLDSGYEFYLPSLNRLVAYDDYIVMPFMNVKDNSFFSRALLLQEICGFIVFDNDTMTLQKTYLKEADLADWDDMIVINEKSISDKLCFE